MVVSMQEVGLVDKEDGYARVSSQMDTYCRSLESRYVGGHTSPFLDPFPVRHKDENSIHRRGISDLVAVIHTRVINCIASIA